MACRFFRVVLSASCVLGAFVGVVYLDELIDHDRWYWMCSIVLEKEEVDLWEFTSCMEDNELDVKLTNSLEVIRANETSDLLSITKEGCSNETLKPGVEDEIRMCDGNGNPTLPMCERVPRVTHYMRDKKLRNIDVRLKILATLKENGTEVIQEDDVGELLDCWIGASGH